MDRGENWNKRNHKRLIIFAVWCFTLVSLNLSFPSCSSGASRGAVAFTFDDSSVEEWAACRDLFRRYGTRATFFVTRPWQLTATQWELLKTLQNDGHEIACHGMNHQSVDAYADSLEAYVDKEVLAAKRYLENRGMPIRSFAYPFGKGSTRVDSLIAPHFSRLRKATYNYKEAPLDAYNEIFANPWDSIVDAMGIDGNYQISLESLERGILRAKREGKLLVLYAHSLNGSGKEYSISPQCLENIFKLCRKHGVTMETLGEWGREELGKIDQ